MAKDDLTTATRTVEHPAPGLLTGSPSRRLFLKSLGLAAGAAAVVPALASAQTATDPGLAPNPGNAVDGLEVLGRGARKIQLTINGSTRPLNVEPRTTLLDALRDDAGLTGAKMVCDRGSCGACSVLIDGVATCSCMTLADDCVGKEVTTIEGIAADPRFAPMIDAFADHDAAQCGYCIPGFVVRAAEVYLSPTAPTTAAGVRDELAGNLCRCGTYTMLFRAMADAIAHRPDGGA